MGKPWNEIDWEAPRPTHKDVSSSHQRIRFTPTAVNSPAAVSLVDTFRSILTNGGAHILAFQVEDVDDTAHWFLSRNRFDEYGFHEQLLTSDALAKALPDLVPIDAHPMEANFQESSALLLDGQLASALIWGGAYGTFDRSAAEAKRVCLEVCRELLGDRYEDFRVDRSHESWCEWFQDVAWDDTWLITDQRNERVTLICLTDTD